MFDEVGYMHVIRSPDTSNDLLLPVVIHNPALMKKSHRHFRHCYCCCCRCFLFVSTCLSCLARSSRTRKYIKHSSCLFIFDFPLSLSLSGSLDKSYLFSFYSPVARPVTLQKWARRQQPGTSQLASEWIIRKATHTHTLTSVSAHIHNREKKR